MFDVTAVGELLIDFTPVTVKDEMLYSPKPGGAPANAAVAVRRLGGSSAFIGKVGDDGFGHMLRDVLAAESVDISGLILDNSVPTTLAFVHIGSEGERSFSFYRRHCADTMLRPDEIDTRLISESKILHFGSVSLTDSPSREAVYYAADFAKSHGVTISCDPNYREPLWQDRASAVYEMKNALKYADIIKVSNEEMTMLTGLTDLAEGSMALTRSGASLVLVTLGAGGAYVRRGRDTELVPAPVVPQVDTNGAGDAFLGAMLYAINNKMNIDYRDAPFSEIIEAVGLSNAAGAFTVTKAGAMSALPTLNQLFTRF